ncbi:PaaI family thioesterase [Rhodocaloribacter sp.]
MPDETHFRKLERMYHAAPCNAPYAPRLTIGDGVAEVVIPVSPALFHAAGAVHGAVYFKAMDDAAFFAANALVRDVLVLTVSFTVYFTRPVSGGALRASARVVHRSRRLLIAEAEVTDARGRTLARGSGSFMPSTIPLTEDVGYV